MNKADFQPWNVAETIKFVQLVKIKGNPALLMRATNITLKVFWEEISRDMTRAGFSRNGLACRKRWKYLRQKFFQYKETEKMPTKAKIWFSTLLTMWYEGGKPEKDDRAHPKYISRYKATMRIKEESREDSQTTQSPSTSTSTIVNEDYLAHLEPPHAPLQHVSKTTDATLRLLRPQSPRASSDQENSRKPIKSEDVPCCNTTIKIKEEIIDGVQTATFSSSIRTNTVANGDHLANVEPPCTPLEHVSKSSTSTVANGHYLAHAEPSQPPVQRSSEPSEATLRLLGPPSTSTISEQEPPRKHIKTGQPELKEMMLLEIQGLRSDLRDGLSSLRSDLREGFHSLATELKQLHSLFSSRATPINSQTQATSATQHMFFSPPPQNHYSSAPNSR